MSSTPSPRSAPRGRYRRWSIVVAMVVIGHAVVLGWLGLQRTRDVEPPAKAHVVVALLKPTRIAGASHAPAVSRSEKSASTPPAKTRAGALQGITTDLSASTASSNGTSPPASRTDVQHTRVDAAAEQRPTTPAPPSPPVAASAPAVTPSPASATATTDAPVAAGAGASGAVGAGTGASSAASGSAGGTGASNGPGSGHGPDSGERYALMPSSDLVYDTFYNGAQNQSGTLHWRTNGKQYELVVSMPVPFIGTYSFISQGHIDAFGLAPDVYTEHRGRRGTDISRFERDGTTRQVAFTRTPQVTPLPDGAQDRFSMIFQLASLVRGNPQRYQPGVTREFDVIDSNSAEIWPIQTIGPETVLRPDGPIQAVHFMRLPRRPGDTRRIDFWLAPALGWIPVRIMQTEPNGTQIELLYRSSTRMPPTSVKLDSAGAVVDTGPSAPTGGASGVPTAPSTPSN